MSQDHKVITQLRRRRDEYQIIDKYIAGMVLTGDEIKSVRNSQVHLEGSYVAFIGNEAFVVDMQISSYKNSSFTNSYIRKRRKLLLKKKEILQIMHKSQLRRCVVAPLAVLIVGRWAKLEIALVKRLKSYQAKERKKKRELERSMSYQEE